jgi:ferric-dicitrate binding protein FerR (iron transport regulator)
MTSSTHMRLPIIQKMSARTSSGQAERAARRAWMHTLAIGAWLGSAACQGVWRGEVGPLGGCHAAGTGGHHTRRGASKCRNSVVPCEIGWPG